MAGELGFALMLSETYRAAQVAEHQAKEARNVADAAWAKLEGLKKEAKRVGVTLEDVLAATTENKIHEMCHLQARKGY